jgi:hypothetical protein
VAHLAEFIATARAAVPELLDEIERLRDELAEVRAKTFHKAADAIDNDECDCGGCDSCQPRKLAAMLREKGAEKSSREADATPEFFQPGHTCAGSGGWNFHCDTLTAHPEDGELTALAGASSTAVGNPSPTTRTTGRPTRRMGTPTSRMAEARDGDRIRPHSVLRPARLPRQADRGGHPRRGARPTPGAHPARLALQRCRRLLP